MNKEDVVRYVEGAKKRGFNFFKFFLDKGIVYSGSIDSINEESISISDKFGVPVLIPFREIENIMGAHGTGGKDGKN